MRARVAAAFWVSTVVLVTGAAAFDVVNRTTGSGDPWLPSIAAAAVGFGTVGALIAGRHPDNPIGWLILAAGVGHAVSGIAIGYGTWAVRRSPTAPGGAVGLWVGNWAWCALAVMPAVFLLFPFGTLPIPAAASRSGPGAGHATAVRSRHRDRRDPLAVMSQLGRRLERAAPEQVLPALAEEVASTLKLPRVAIELSDGVSATHGAGGGEPLVLPLTFESRQVGRLTVAARSSREAFSRAERELLEGVARQLGVAAYAVRSPRTCNVSGSAW